MYKIIIALLCVCIASSDAISAKWSPITPNGEPWIKRRGYFQSAGVTIKNTPAFLVPGGYGETGCCSNTLAYLPAANKYMEVMRMPLPVNESLTGFSATSTDANNAYVYGGDLSSKAKANNTMYHFAANTGKWDVYDNKGTPLTQHSTVYYKNNLIVYGGRQSVDEFSGYSFQLYVFNIPSKTWGHAERNHSNLLWPSARASHGAVVVGDVMYILGGNDFDGCLKDPFWQLDLKTFKWMPVEVVDELACKEDMIFDVININGTSYLIIANGWGYDKIWNTDVWLMNTETQEWIQADIESDRPGANRGTAWGVYDNEIYTLGGCYQVGEEPYCDYSDEMWKLTLKI